MHTKRPDRHVDDMNVDLIERWSEVVKPSDEVYILRDLAMGPIAEMLALMKLFHGTRLLVPGNRDKCWDGLRGRRNSVDEWRSQNEAAGVRVLESELEVRVGDELVSVSQFPYEGDSQKGERFAAFRPRDRGPGSCMGTRMSSGDSAGD